MNGFQVGKVLPHRPIAQVQFSVIVSVEHKCLQLPEDGQPLQVVRVGEVVRRDVQIRDFRIGRGEVGERAVGEGEAALAHPQRRQLRQPRQRDHVDVGDLVLVQDDARRVPQPVQRAADMLQVVVVDGDVPQRRRALEQRVREPLQLVLRQDELVEAGQLERPVVDRRDVVVT